MSAYNSYSDQYPTDASLSEDRLEFTQNEGEESVIYLQPRWESGNLSVCVKSSPGSGLNNITSLGPDRIETGSVQTSNITSADTNLGLLGNVTITQTGNVSACHLFTTTMQAFSNMLNNEAVHKEALLEVLNGTIDSNVNWILGNVSDNYVANVDLNSRFSGYLIDTNNTEIRTRILHYIEGNLEQTPPNDDGDSEIKTAIRNVILTGLSSDDTTLKANIEGIISDQLSAFTGSTGINLEGESTISIDGLVETINMNPTWRNTLTDYVDDITPLFLTTETYESTYTFSNADDFLNKFETTSIQLLDNTQENNNYFTALSNVLDIRYITPTQLSDAFDGYLQSADLELLVEDKINTFGPGNIVRDYLEENYVSLDGFETTSIQLLDNTQENDNYFTALSNVLDIRYITPTQLSDAFDGYLQSADLELLVEDKINTFGPGNIVRDYLEENYVSLDVFESADSIFNTVQTMIAQSETEQGALYVARTELVSESNVSIIQYPVYPTVNVYQFELEGKIHKVDIALTSSANIEFSANIDNNNLVDIHFDESPIVDGLSLEPGHTILIPLPIMETGLSHTTTTYNGIFEVLSVSSSVAQCERSTTFRTVEDIARSMVYVKPGEQSGHFGRSSGNSYLVVNPSTVSEPNPFALNESNIEFIQMSDNNLKSMSAQSHDNVNITGGNVALSLLRTSVIKPSSNDVTVRLPDEDGTFTVQVDSVESNDDIVFQVNGMGDVTAFQFNSLSDNRLKQNIATIQNPLTLVSNLHGKTFEWNDASKNTRGRSYGFIAQEVGQNFPSLVNETLDGYLAVDYAKVVSILVESVKNIHDRVVTLGLDSNPSTYVNPNTQPTVESFHECCSNNNGCTGGCTCTCQPSGNIQILPSPYIGNLSTNMIGFGSVGKVQFANIASVPDDVITVEPTSDPFVYTIYTNGGLNTLDSANLAVNDTILVKDCPSKQYNGVYEIINILPILNVGKYSRCRRATTFNDFGNMSGTMVCVNPPNLYGHGKGDLNPGNTFTCTEPMYIDDFTLDESNISFISFGVQQSSLGSMAKQDSNNVNITGGTVNVPIIELSEIRPLSNYSDVNVILNGSSSDDVFKVDTPEGTVLSVNGMGIVSAKEFYAPSDSRLKKNVEGISKSIELVRKLRGVTFDWNDFHSDHPQYGLIAQEVNIHFPSLVHSRPDGMLAVDYSKIVSILVEAVKDLSNMVNMP